MAKGLELNSFAAMCAQLFGLPQQVVQRAQHVRYDGAIQDKHFWLFLFSSHLLSTHELGRLLDEDMTDKERLEFEEAEEVCRKFLAWDFDTAKDDSRGNIKEILGKVLGRNTESWAVETPDDCG